MPIIWNVPLIALSIIAAIIGSISALTHSHRMRLSSGRIADLWMIMGGITLGLAIWSMHFVGMAAFHLEIPIGYDLSLTVISILPGIASALFAFFILRQRVISFRRMLITSLLMGIGICAMHYLGMAAIQMSPPIEYETPAILFSIVIAVLASYGAIFMMYRESKIRLPLFVKLLAGGVVMGFAISGMHYVSMAGMVIAPGSICTTFEAGGAENLPVKMVFAAALAVFGGGILTSSYDHLTTRKTIDTLQKLKRLHHKLQKSNKELAEQEELLRTITDAAQDAVILLNSKGLIIYWNIAAEKMFGHLKTEIIGKNFHHLFAPRRYAGKYEKGFQYFEATGAGAKVGATRRLNAMHADGKEFPVDISLASVQLHGEWAAVGIVRDMTEKVKAEKKIKKLAFYDPLTTLPNRRLLLERCFKAIVKSKRTKKYGALLFIDLDNFKGLNDTKGHDMGDLLLVEVAKRLRKNIRKGDTAARMGGDEFVIILEELDMKKEKALSQMNGVAEKIRTVLNESYHLKGYEHHLSPSIGVCIFYGATYTTEELLMNADKAMYEAKRAGRNAVRIYSDSA